MYHKYYFMDNPARFACQSHLEMWPRSPATKERIRAVNPPSSALGLRLMFNSLCFPRILIKNTVDKLGISFVRKSKAVE